MADAYFTEQQTPDMRLGLRVSGLLHQEQTPYQRLAVYESTGHGRVLVLDDVIQLTCADEWAYHEMIAHVPLAIHPAPASVLVVGGGDGGALREVLRHPEVVRADLVDIDAAVVRASREFLPAVSSGFSDPRARVIIADGIEHAARCEAEYDAVIVDSTDPVGPAVGLFQPGFYRSVYRGLKQPGVMSQQVGSPFYGREAIRRAVAAARGAFPVVRLYLGSVPTYPGGLWCYLLAVKGELAIVPPPGREWAIPTRYYSPEVHRQGFALPPFVAELLHGPGNE